MDCKLLLPQCFDARHRLGSGLEARLAAVEYLRCNVQHQNGWMEIEAQIIDHLKEQSVPTGQIDQELRTAKSLLESWLP